MKDFIFILLCGFDVYCKMFGLLLWKIKKYSNYWSFSTNIGWVSPQTNQIWVDTGGECYGRSIKSWLQDNKEMYSTYKGGKIAYLF